MMETLSKLDVDCQLRQKGRLLFLPVQRQQEFCFHQCCTDLHARRERTE